MSARSSRLPRWFKWWVPVEVTIALVPSIILTVAIAAVIPAEDAPCIAKLKDGSTAYCLQSLRQLILPSVFVVLLIPFMAIAIRVCPPSRDYVRRNEQRWRQSSPAMRKIGYAVGHVFLAIFVALLSVGFVVLPCCTVKKVIVKKDVVIAERLLSSRHIPRADITRARLRCEKEKARVSVRFDIQRRDGQWHLISEQRFGNADPALQRYVNLMRQLVSHVNQW